MSTKETVSVYRAVPKKTHIGDAAAECFDCTWHWFGEADYATAANAARAHTQRTGHNTHWSDERSGGYKGEKRERE